MNLNCDSTDKVKRIIHKVLISPWYKKREEKQTNLKQFIPKMDFAVYEKKAH